jgi:hypothetical protein
MSIRYELIIYWSEQDQAFLVEVPELPGCMSDGETVRTQITCPDSSPSRPQSVMDKKTPPQTT